MKYLVWLRDMAQRANRSATGDPSPRLYGHSGTIHHTGHLDVGVDEDGVVVAVWYRCMLLPFRQYSAGPQSAVGRGNPDIFIEAIEWTAPAG